MTTLTITANITNNTYSYAPNVGQQFVGIIDVLNVTTNIPVSYVSNYTVISTTSASATFLINAPPINTNDQYIIQAFFTFNNNTVITPLVGPGTVILGTATFTAINPVFNLNASFSNNYFYPELGSVIGTQIGFTSICVHGSSLIETINGQKRIDQLEAGDKVLSGKNLDQYATVLSLGQCWLSFQGVDHDSIIFEKDSLGPNQPSNKLIIDPGHPMCTQTEYLEKGYEELRPAGTFWEERNQNQKIHSKKWTDDLIENETSRRYDLILEEPFNTYVANGIVVRARGYRDHRYKNFV